MSAHTPGIAQTMCVGTIEEQLRFATNTAQELLEQRDQLSLALMAATDRETALVAAIKTIASVPGLTDYEASHLDARAAWHAALNHVYSKARAALARAAGGGK